MLLLIKVHTLFRLPEFFPNVLFFFFLNSRIPSRDVIFSHHFSLGSSWLRKFLIVSLFLVTLKLIWYSVDQYWDFSGTFIMTKLGLWVCRKKPQRSKAFLAKHWKNSFLNLAYHWWWWPWSPGWECQVSTKFLFFPFSHWIFERKWLCTAHIEAMGKKYFSPIHRKKKKKSRWKVKSLS